MSEHDDPREPLTPAEGLPPAEPVDGGEPAVGATVGTGAVEAPSSLEVEATPAGSEEAPAPDGSPEAAGSPEDSPLPDGEEAPVAEETPDREPGVDRPDSVVPVLTGEEVRLADPTADTGILFGTADSPIETGLVEPVVVGTTIPRTQPTAPRHEEDEADADLPDTQPSPTVTEEEVPDVLSHRRGDDDPDDPSTTAVRRSLMTPSTPAEGQPEAAWRSRFEAVSAPEQVASGTPRTLDDALLEGTTVVPEVPSRAGAHVWSLIVTLLLTVPTWWALVDSMSRLGADAAANTPAPFVALLEFVGALVGIFLVLLCALRSSLGAWVTGVLLVGVGVPWIVAPKAVMAVVDPVAERVGAFRGLGGGLVDHLHVSGLSGLFVVMGALMLAVAWVSHGTRRRGRHEEAVRAEVERVNPVGAHLSWFARRRAAKNARD